ncbi:MAG: 4-(cytidine 5'-diphospho)-2-C-methyl-D-erythritol kinase [Muribaculaceae bacterium]|nr:4-(cytidine 5'-diphospho)-2-C-methyl-D-erythritol kinase [Muribaculaceae bacterium]
MLFFPNAKINLGLRILRRRPDGYHDIASLMLPVDWCDILEMTPAQGEGSFRQTGTALDCPPDKNLVLKAIKAVEKHIGHSLPPLDIILEKHIPFGAGLGGGSADAAFAIMGANLIFGLGLDDDTMARIAATVGADCAFFIYDRPMEAAGIGDVLRPVDCSALSGCGILIAKPESESVSTAAAYAGVTPAELAGGVSPADALSCDINTWKDNELLRNDFETSIFALRPEIAAVRTRMAEAGAFYSSMSGSGASVFGFFDNVDSARKAAALFPDCAVHAGDALPTNVLPPQSLL